MEPILSKQEIADLLSTLQHRGPATGEEFDAATVADTASYSEIDLFHPSAVRHEPDKIPNFDIILGLFSEYYSSALSQSLQCSIEVTGTTIEYHRFNTYLVLESYPGAIGLIKAEPLKFGGLITFSPQLAFSMLELLLGGTPQPDNIQPERTATRLELCILESLMKQGCHALQQALIPVVDVDAELVKTTHDRRLVSLVNPDTELVVCSFNVRSDHISETMQLVFPTLSFAPYRDALDKLFHLDDLDANDWIAPLSNSLDSILCTAMARAATIDMTIKDLITLETGDVLMLSSSPAAKLELLVEGKHKFSGYQKIRARRRYFHITEIIE